MKRDRSIAVARVLDPVEAELVAHVGHGVPLDVVPVLLNHESIAVQLLLWPEVSHLKKDS